MGLQIEDGTGKGYLAAVTSTNLLRTESDSRSVINARAKTGDAYIISTPLLTITTTLGNILYIKNTSTTKNFHIDRALWSWDGGSTNFNRPLFTQFIVAAGAPSANNTTGVAANTNFTSGNVAELDVEYWDEVSTGMTQAAGTIGNNTILTQGSLMIEVEGSFILGKGDTFTLAARGQEAGEVTVAVLGYFE